MPDWPSLTTGGLVWSPLGLLPLPWLLLLATRPRPLFHVLACLSCAPLLAVAPGPALLGGVAVLALVARGWAVPAQARATARMALLWLPVAILHGATTLPLMPGLACALAALAASLAIAATLQADMRWPLALLLALLPFAPVGEALMQPAQRTAELPWQQVAARWQYSGPGAIAVADLVSPWPVAERLARILLFVAVLMAFVAVRRSANRLAGAAALLPFVALALLVGQSLALLQSLAHAPGVPFVAVAAPGCNAVGLALAGARIATVWVLLRHDLSMTATRLDAWAGTVLGVTLALAALAAPAIVGPAWLADPVALALVAMLVSTLVRGQASSASLARAAGLVQVAAGAAFAGGATAGLATASQWLR